MQFLYPRRVLDCFCAASCLANLSKEVWMRESMMEDIAYGAYQDNVFPVSECSNKVCNSVWYIQIVFKGQFPNIHTENLRILQSWRGYTIFNALSQGLYNSRLANSSLAYQARAVLCFSAEAFRQLCDLIFSTHHFAKFSLYIQAQSSEGQFWGGACADVSYDEENVCGDMHVMKHAVQAAVLPVCVDWVELLRQPCQA